MIARATQTRLLRATQVAKFCNVDLKTIHNWANRGKIPCCRTPGRHLRFRRLDVVDFLRAYRFAFPEALRQGRPRVAMIEGDPIALAAMQRVLARRFDVAAFDQVIDGLVELAATDPDVLVLGDVSPLELGAITARLCVSEAMRHVRIVTVGGHAPGAAAWAPPGDFTTLRETLETLAGVD
jgi:excisionase family DNA binding protein